MADHDDGEGESLDPRVEGALLELNQATDEINVVEKALEVGGGVPASTCASL